MESPADDLAIRRRRALYRATHRGSKELDFLLGRFAEQTIETMSEAELCVLERLIDAPDPDIEIERIGLTMLALATRVKPSASSTSAS